jgi:hypothetical protein
MESKSNLSTTKLSFPEGRRSWPHLLESGSDWSGRKNEWNPGQAGSTRMDAEWRKERQKKSNKCKDAAGARRGRWGLICVAFWTEKESDGRKPNEEDDPSSR